MEPISPGFDTGNVTDVVPPTDTVRVSNLPRNCQSWWSEWCHHI